MLRVFVSSWLRFMSYEFLTIRRDGPVEYLTLNRPDVRNAFNEQVIAELAEWASAVSESARRHEVRAVVLAGAGPAFCAGGDAKWMSSTIGLHRGREPSRRTGDGGDVSSARRAARATHLPDPRGRPRRRRGAGRGLGHRGRGTRRHLRLHRGETRASCRRSSAPSSSRKLASRPRASCFSRARASPPPAPGRSAWFTRS